MSVFEFIILIIYYFFSNSYVSNAMEIRNDEGKLLMFLETFVAGLLGPILFPIILGEHLYKKLNNK